MVQLYTMIRLESLLVSYVLSWCWRIVLEVASVERSESRGESEGFGEEEFKSVYQGYGGREGGVVDQGLLYEEEEGKKRSGREQDWRGGEGRRGRAHLFLESSTLPSFLPSLAQPSDPQTTLPSFRCEAMVTSSPWSCSTNGTNRKDEKR